jgi:phosphoserine aminotransferase
MSIPIINFNAGPAGLPKPALIRARDEFMNFEGTGISIMEHSHRGASYDGVHQTARRLVKDLLEVPDSHDVLFIQGGASQIFALLPMNFLRAEVSADYVITGTWSKKALAEAKLVGLAKTAGTGEVDGKFIRVPKQDELNLDSNAAYCHFTSNNTVAGTQYHEFIEAGDVPLVADMSSDIMWRPIDVSKFSLIYAGAQKNIGPSGVALVIVKKDWLEQASTSIPNYFRFKTHLDKQSLYNTPATFSVYMIRNVLEHVQKLGGLPVIHDMNQRKAAILYDAIGSSSGFYHSPIEPDSRSSMNVVFRLPNEAAEAQFIAAAAEEGMIGLKGHRSVGGCRASIYNAVSVDAVSQLADFMGRFSR